MKEFHRWVFWNLKIRVQENLKGIFLGSSLLGGSAPQLATSSPAPSALLPALPCAQPLLNTRDQNCWPCWGAKDYTSEVQTQSLCWCHWCDVWDAFTTTTTTTKNHVCNMKYKFSSVKLQAVKYRKAAGVMTLWGKLAEEENKKHSCLS